MPIVNHVNMIFGRYSPKSELEKALIIFRSVIRPNISFKFNGVYISGLKEQEGGLEIYPNESDNTPLRFHHGLATPEQIITTPKHERSVVCLEYAFLLTVMLRYAGIETNLGRSPGHAFALAMLDGGKYIMDAMKEDFSLTNRESITDDQALAMFYCQKGDILSIQGKHKQSIIYINEAIELDPKLPEAWQNKGVALLEYGQRLSLADKNMMLIEADTCFQIALKLNPISDQALNNRGIIAYHLGKPELAISFFQDAIKINPNNFGAINSIKVIRSQFPNVSPYTRSNIIKNDLTTGNLTEQESPLLFEAPFDNTPIQHNFSQDQNHFRMKERIKRHIFSLLKFMGLKQ